MLGGMVEMAALALMPATPALASSIMIGTNGHDTWTTPTWLNYNAATAFAMMNQHNIRSYRVDVANNPASFAALTKLLALGQKYNIIIRPMLYIDSGQASDAYTIAKAFASSIHVWELGNELNLRGPSQFTASINLMLQARKGIMQAAAETGQPLQTAINVTSGWGTAALSPTAPTYPFIDQAIAMGLQFDYITYHYYPGATDRSGGWMKRYLDPLRKYGKPVLLNETNCAQIYNGDNGNSSACTLVANDILTVVRNNYSDIVSELDFYEIIDDPSSSGVEGHFGVMFNQSLPKNSLVLAEAFAAPFVPPAAPVVQNSASLGNSQFITMAFPAALNRNASASDMSFWTGLLAHSSSGRRTLITSAVNSVEFQNNAIAMDNQAYVARLFLAVLGRPVDMASMTFYGGELDALQTTRMALVQTLLSCREFQTRPL